MTGTSRLPATPPRPGGGADGGRPSVAPAAGQDRVRTENAFPPTESRPRAPAKGRSGHATPRVEPAAAMVHWTAMSRLCERRGIAGAVCPLGQTVSSGLWPPGRTLSQRPGAFSTVRLFHLDTAQVRPRALRAAATHLPHRFGAVFAPVLEAEPVSANEPAPRQRVHRFRVASSRTAFRLAADPAVVAHEFRDGVRQEFRQHTMRVSRPVVHRLTPTVSAVRRPWDALLSPETVERKGLADHGGWRFIVVGQPVVIAPGADRSRRGTVLGTEHDRARGSSKNRVCQGKAGEEVGRRVRTLLSPMNLRAKCD